MAAGLNSSEALNARDVGRGLAIVAVMYGHALAPWFMQGGDHFSYAAFVQWKFGAAFMMSFFFFLSGVGWRSNRRLGAAIQQGLSLIIVAWLANIAFDIVRIGLSLAGLNDELGLSALGIGGFLRSELRLALLTDTYSLDPMWFLGALGLVRILAALAVRGGDRVGLAMGVGVALLTIAANEYGWRNVAQITLLGPAFGFFLAGYALKRLWARGGQALGACAAVMVLALGLTAASFGLNQGCRWDASAICGADWLNGRFGVAMIHGMFGNWGWFALTAIVGTIFASCLSILLARYGAIVGAGLASLGRASMDLLIVNAFFLLLLNPVVSVVLAPHLPAQGVFFFVGLLTVTIVLNLLTRLILARQLKQLRMLARKLAIAIVDTFAGAFANAAVMLKPYRVSREYD